MSTTKTTITKEERAARAEQLRQIRHSTEMEGGRSSGEARADQDAWACGEMSIDELLERVKARHAQ